jgi:hypothetical protein
MNGYWISYGTNSFYSLPPAGADSQPVTPATVTETKSLTEVLGSTSLYSKGQMPPTPNWNSTKKWEVSTDWKAPEEGNRHYVIFCMDMNVSILIGQSP